MGTVETRMLSQWLLTACYFYVLNRFCFSKKRRSSFARGRKSQGVTEADHVENFLPEGLSENEKRLRLCLEECLVQLSHEMPDLEEFDQFKVQVRTKVKERLKELTVEEPIKKSNPVSDEIDRQLTILPTYIEKLKAEQETWDEMVRTRELLAGRAQAQAEAVADNPTEFELTLKISEPERKLLSKKPDYSSIHSEVLHEFEKVAIAMEEIPKCVCAVDQAVKSIANRLSKETLQLHEESFPPSEYNPSEILYRRLQCDF